MKSEISSCTSFWDVKSLFFAQAWGVHQSVSVRKTLRWGDTRSVRVTAGCLIKYLVVLPRLLSACLCLHPSRVVRSVNNWTCAGKRDGGRGEKTAFWKCFSPSFMFSPSLSLSLSVCVYVPLFFSFLFLFAMPCAQSHFQIFMWTFYILAIWLTL